MAESVLNILEVLGEHFSNAIAEPGETLESIISELDEMNSANRYEFIRQIGEGGLKKVSLEKDKVTQREVAISSLSGEQPHEEVLRFINEAYLTARLGHNNIVPLYDFGRRDGNFYFTAKYLDGESFASYLRKDHALHEKLRIFSDICDGIGFAHSQGIVHLDIKAANIQITEHSEVIIFDWGLARDLRSDEGLESYFEEIFAGSPGYTAPEQILSKTDEMDERTDIYSLGAILFQILTGSIPWKDSEMKQVLKNTLSGDPSVLEQQLLKYGAPGSLISVCMKALARDRKERYESVKQLKSEITAYLNGFVTQAEDASYFKMLFLLIKRHKIPFGISLVFIVALSLTFSHWQQRLQEEQRKISELNISKARVLYDKALNSYNSFEIESAEEEINESLQLDVSNRSLYLKAKILLVKGQYKETLETIKNLDEGSWENNRIKEVLSSINLEGEAVFENAVDGILEKHLPGITLFMVKYKYSKLPLEEKLSLARSLLRLFNGEQAVFSLEGEEKLTFKCGPKVGRLIPLVDLPIVHIDASKSVLYNIDSLKGMKSLKYLNLSDTYVEDLKALEGLDLDYLNLSNTCVVDLKALKNSKVSYLDIRGQKLKYLTMLLAMPNIEKIKLDESRYTSYRGIRDLGILKQQKRIVND